MAAAGRSDSIIHCAAVIGAGYLGARIAAELLLLGSEVAVYDRGLVDKGLESGQAELNRAVRELLRECAQHGLLQEAGMNQVGPDWPWAAYADQSPHVARLCSTISESVMQAGIVIEAVPDNLELKSAVFAEAAAAAPVGALLATSTLSLELARLQCAIVGKLGKSGGSPPPRVVGLRFLAPVVFIPVVEITLTAAQVDGERCEDREALLQVLRQWGKSAFVCDVEGAAEGSTGLEDESNAWRRGAARLRLDGTTARRRQFGEARIRRAHHDGPLAVAALTAADIYDFGGGEIMCCICLDARPCVKSVICGHCVLCTSCAEVVKRLQQRCPVCREQFAEAICIGSDFTSTGTGMVK